jgi:TPP-dependent pyruvate/acetoin dehydrogenase alpha subunit
MKYVPKEQVEEWRKKDPLDRQAAREAELGVDVEALRAEVQATIDEATQEALAGPMPDPQTASDRVFFQPTHPDEELLLGDGQAPYSAFATGGGA